MKGRENIDVTLSALQAPLQEIIVTGLGKGRANADMASNYKLYSPSPLHKIAQGNISTTQGYYKSIGDDKEEYFNTEGYDHITENRFLKVTDNPLSTFSIDVDAASYSNVRRF
ncbi:MAG: von Willebrand factor type A domain-containing protein, partial [Bacteroidia bacterium]|nr:von Willebrand factor type A domain-containing protein [Bacteroidia bacterium]